jgi:hypothetical protein
MKKTLIFQASRPRTATTLLSNALHGLIDGLSQKRIIYVDYYYDYYEKYYDDIIVVKTHNMSFHKIVEQFSEKYNLFFISSERKDKNLLINDHFKSYDNICIFQYEELNETQENNVSVIAENIYNKVNNLLNEKFNLNIKLDKEKCINRINEMNQKVIELKDKPFYYVDQYYHVHGSHRTKVENTENTDNTDNTDNKEK